MQHSSTLIKAQLFNRLGRLAVAISIVAVVALATASTASAIPGDGGGGGGTTVEVNISAPVANSVHANGPGLSFTKTAATAATCLVDGDFDNATEFCSSGWTPPYLLSEGTHTYSVAIASADGSSTASANRSFVIDRTAPGISLAKPNAPVSGNPTIGITVTDVNPDQINCSLNGGLFTPCGSSATAGSFSANYPDGSYDLAVEAVDKAGNANVVYAPFTVDKSAPLVSITTGWGAQTSDVTPEFDFSINDLTTTSKNCHIVGVTTPAACASAHTVAALPDGTHTLQVSATDAAGNTGSAQFAFTIDATAPSLAIGGLTDNQTTNRTPLLSADAADVHLDAVRCAYDVPVSEATPADSCTVPAAELAFGQHSFNVRASDTYGNVTEQSYVFTVIDPSVPPADSSAPNGPEAGNGTTAPPAAVSLASKSGKAKGGRVPVTVTVTVKPAAGAAACSGSVKIAVKPGKGKAVTRVAGLKVVGGTCIAKTTIKLAKKLKGKKSTVTAAFAGSDKVAPFLISKSLRRL